MKKIMVVSNMYPNKEFPTYGTFVKTFCDEAIGLGIDVDLKVMHKGNSKLDKIKNYIKFYSGTFVAILSHRYDCIYLHYASYSSLPVILASMIRKVTIYTNVHGTDVLPITSGQKIMENFTRIIVKRSEKIIVPSKYFAQVMVDKYNVNEEAIYEYPSGGIDKGKFYKYTKSRKDELRNKYGVPQESLLIGYVSRIVKGKGWDIYIEAIHLYKKENINFKGIIVGSGVERGVLDKMLCDYGLEEDIIVLDAIPNDELADIYNIMDIFTFPSELQESLGLVGLEALSCGTPIISTNQGGPIEYVIEGENGEFFKSGCSQDLAKKLQKILVEKGVSAYKDIEESVQKYSRVNIKERMIDIFFENEDRNNRRVADEFK